MMSLHSRHGRSAFLCLIIGVGLFWSMMSIAAGPDDDPEEREFLRATAQRAVLENCTICHSHDLIVSQRLTSPQWKAEVEKMIGWGSPLPKDDQAKVVAYLAEEYALTSVPLKLTTLSLREATEPGRPESRGESRFRDLSIPTRVLVDGRKSYVKDCANCHGIDGQGAELGPNLVEKAILSRPTEFAKIIETGKGRMPAFGKRVDPDTTILIWLRSLRYAPPATNGFSGPQKGVLNLHPRDRTNVHTTGTVPASAGDG